MNPRLHAIIVSCAEPNVGVPLLTLFPEFQVEVDELTSQLTRLLTMTNHTDWVNINKAAILELMKYDIEVVIDVEYSNAAVAITPYAVFEAAPKLRFAF
jgi:hypothetical protein